MTTAKRFLICLGCILAGSAIWAQPAEENPNATSTPTTGTVTITLTVTVATAGVKAMYCSGIVTANDGSPTSPSFTSFDVSTTVAGPVTGATRTCTISVPYSFPLATASTDRLSISYTVSATTGASPLGRNFTQSPLATLPMPANGTKTSKSASVTI
jgi:hypothetical protein